MAYLDHAASTTIRPGAMEAWREAALRVGNPASAHSAGRWGRRVVEESRELIAARLEVRPDSIIFTSGGTEADNTAIVGTVNARRRQNPRRDLLVVSPIEHKAVLEPAESLTQTGVAVEYLKCDSRGVIDLDHLDELLAQNLGRVAAVSVMWANNEVGSVQPVPEVVAACSAAKVPVHTDAVQAVGSPGLDLSLPNTAAMSAHKFGGPKGVGLLLHQGRYPLDPLLRGGGQESGMRAGTSDVPGIAGMAAAVDELFRDHEESTAKYRKLRDRLVAGILETIPDVVINGDPESGLPGLVHMSFLGCEGDALMLLLDTVGVQVSVGSACAAGATETSHVMRAMGVDFAVARGSLRFSVGWSTSDDDIDSVLQVLPDVVSRARRADVSSVRSG
jgi:cysteine desulfurase